MSQRIAFYARKGEFDDRGLDFVYETWMVTCYTVKKCWQGEETPGVIPPNVLMSYMLETDEVFFPVPISPTKPNLSQ